MCFNTQSSLIAFTLGSSACLYLISQKHYYYGLFGLSIVIMQLLEYFAHRSIKSKNLQLNILSGKLMLITVFLQPIIYCFLLSIIPPHGITFFISKSYLIVIPLLLLYILIFGFYLKHVSAQKKYRVGYINKCRRVCRLNWEFLDGKNSLCIIIILIYFLLINLYTFYYPGRKMVNISNYLFLFLLFISIFYIIIKDKIKTFPMVVSSFGSLWCFLAVVYPLLMCIYAYNKLI